MKKYDRYKDSGIEWIGRIPEHWTATRIKYLARNPTSLFIDGDWIESRVIVDSGIKYITTGNIKEGYYSEQGFGFITERTFLELNCTEVFEGDLLISRLNLPIGRACIIPNLGARIVTSVDNVILRPDSNISRWFLLFLFSSQLYFEHTGLIARGATMQRISRGLLGNISIPLPSFSEQKAIANFLKRKTSEIDSLISKKKKLISLLKEERRAIINQAVTKGIDPSVKYKYSGIEWIGEIPEHWNVRRLRTISKEIKTGSTPPSDEMKYFSPEEIDWFGPADFDSLVLKKSKRKISKVAITDKKCRLFPARTILLVGIGATVGKVGISSGACSSNQQINAIIPKDNFNPHFCVYFLSSIRKVIINEATSATLPIFNQTQTKNLVFPIPSLEEQTQIVSFIESKTSEIDAIVTKTENEITLIKEYKSALINDVVTGKIDVRDAIDHNQDKLQDAHK